MAFRASQQDAEVAEPVRPRTGCTTRSIAAIPSALNPVRGVPLSQPPGLKAWSEPQVGADRLVAFDAITLKAKD